LSHGSKPIVAPQLYLAERRALVLPYGSKDASVLHLERWAPMLSVDSMPMVAPQFHLLTKAGYFTTTWLQHNSNLVHFHKAKYFQGGKSSQRKFPSISVGH
jgi:hypothetical protein